MLRSVEEGGMRSTAVLRCRLGPSAECVVTELAPFFGTRSKAVLRCELGFSEECVVTELAPPFGMRSKSFGLSVGS